MEKTVYFRAFEEEDALLIHKWKNDERINKLTVGLNKKTCYAEDLEWVKSHMFHHPYSAYWAICSKETNKMIGWTSIVNIHYINSSAEAGAIVIGDSDFNDGFAWLETIFYLFEYAFEKLGLNRLYGVSLVGHPTSNRMGKLMFMKTEGILRQAAFKNGRFYDLQYIAILKNEYFAHKKSGDYKIMGTIRRLRKLLKEETEQQN